jgi:hypothetical protein
MLCTLPDPRFLPSSAISGNMVVLSHCAVVLHPGGGGYRLGCGGYLRHQILDINGNSGIGRVLPEACWFKQVFVAGIPKEGILLNLPWRDVFNYE